MNIKEEQLRLVLDNNFSSAIGSYGVSIFITLILFYLTENFVLFLWFAYMLVTTSVRAWVNHNVQQIILQGGFKEQHEQIIHATIILTALGWALLVLGFVEENQPVANAFILITVIGIMLTSMSALIYTKKFYFSFVLISVTPVIFVLISMEGVVYKIFMLQVILFLIYILKNGDIFSKKLINNIELLDRNDQLIKDLKKQKNRAEEISELKSQFLANMSHEIRTPLNGIMGFVQVLQMQETDKTKLNYLKTISQSSHDLLHIIDTILDFSKLEKNQVQLEVTDFDPKALIESCVDASQIRAVEKSIKINFHELKQLPDAIISDPLRLKQVINNLLSNAIKFSTMDSRIDVSADYLKQEQKLKVTIVDQGIGIKEDKLEFIFQSFTQADNSTTRQYGGTGLGLSITANLVKLMGGEISAESTLGVGSIFTFTVSAPLVHSFENDTDDNQQANDAKAQINNQILIVEDNLINQKLLAEFLKHFGYDYDIANDGQQAVDAFKLKRYQAILMDENMPKMSGTEATREIRKLEQQKGLQPVPIIAVTANALKGDRERFLQSGMDEYIAKPINPDTLKSILQRFVK